ncbi:MAG: hypothetical protein ACR2NN_01280 [Bryobacteraceae bacterium]
METRHTGLTIPIRTNIREPGHVEYAATLGLGTYDLNKIQVRTLEL